MSERGPLPHFQTIAELSTGWAAMLVDLHEPRMSERGPLPHFQTIAELSTGWAAMLVDSLDAPWIRDLKLNFEQALDALRAFISKTAGERDQCL